MRDSPANPGGDADEAVNRRRSLRVLFDQVAVQYQHARLGYPDELIDQVLGRARPHGTGRVLEVGCGTGQLTRALGRDGVTLTSIDIGPRMVAEARRQVGDPSVTFEVSSFEDFGLEPELPRFDLIVSGDAFHWVDPVVGWRKAAQLLAPGGWLALIAVREVYPDSLETGLRQLWIEHHPDGSGWVGQMQWADQMLGTGLLAPPIESLWRQPVRLSADRVVDLECTRATYLSFDEATRSDFRAGLLGLLDGTPEVDLSRETVMTMARVLRLDA